MKSLFAMLMITFCIIVLLLCCASAEGNSGVTFMKEVWQALLKLSRGVFEASEAMLKVYVVRGNMWISVVGRSLAFMLLRLPLVKQFLALVWIADHEILHGLAAVLCGGKVVKLDIGFHNGSATTNRSGFIVRIFPYCFPLFSLMAVLLSYIVIVYYSALCVVLSGILYGNFVIQHIRSIAIQPDIRRSGGRAITYPVIIFANISVMVLIQFLIQRVPK